jgi:hypothetical protein
MLLVVKIGYELWNQIIVMKKKLLELRNINAKVEIGPEGSLLAQLKVRSVFLEKILGAQQNDIEVSKIKYKIEFEVKTLFQILDDGMVVMGKRMYVLRHGFER